jgi:phosphatidylinositol 4-kinase
MNAVRTKLKQMVKENSGEKQRSSSAQRNAEDFTKKEAEKQSDLLMRGFESEFFDAWIAVSYLYRQLSRDMRQYLCQRLYTMPEFEVESYLSQLCQLCTVPGGDEDVQQLVVDLSANSLNIAVKVYWILLAISQDKPNDELIAKLRDQCELAGLEGHWQLPFKDVQLPAPIARRQNRFFRNSQGHGVNIARSSLDASFSGIDKFSSSVEAANPLGTSPDILSPRLINSGHSEQNSRSPSPDGLGTGLFSSVFVDTGVEGLIYETGPYVEEHALISPGSSLTEPSSTLSSTQDIKNIRTSESINSTAFSNVTFIAPSKSNSTILEEISPPSSPKRRETTFGATLDFVEALCSASSSLVSFADQDRQWALQKFLGNLNAEIEKASSHGVAIWFPMTLGAPQRVVRLACKESRLLNSSEKAPFTLLVEVLNEDVSVLEAEGILSPASGSLEVKARSRSNDVDQIEIDQLSRKLSSELQSIEIEGPKAAVAEAAAIGITWTSQHHRKSSSHDFSPSSIDSIAMAAVQGSSAANNALVPPKENLVNVNTPSILSQRSEASILASEISLADFVSDSSPDSPHTIKTGGSDGELEQRSSSQLSSNPVHLPRPPVQGGGTWIGGINPKPLGAKTLGYPSGAEGKAAISSPRIHAAIAGLKGEAPLVSVHINVLQSANQISRGDIDAPKLQESMKRVICHNNTLMCRLGMCRCKSENLQRNTEPSKDRLVSVHFVVGGGLDLTVKPPISRHRRMPSREALLQVAKQHKLPAPQVPHMLEHPVVVDHNVSEKQKKETAESIYGEKWNDRRERLRKKSPHGSRPGWDLRCVIVKSGDDCRQELLSMQLIRTFHTIFLEAGLPLWLRPYEVLVTSNRTALIEMVPNAPSIHSVKSASPPGSSLRDHFVAKYGEHTPEHERAQENFVESMAAYSLVCYILQIRDRHNGNLLLDDEGHIIHIDFGFMLSNSPGGVNFESAPFKLTRELLEIMDSDSEGKSSPHFDYFKILMIQGFLAVRKHADRIVELVSMMTESGCPCFKNKMLAVDGLRKRLALGMSEENVVKHVLTLISDSLDAWRTRQYDYYQRVLNGIL